MTKHKNYMFKCLCPPKYGGPLCEGATRIVNCNNLFSFILDNTNQFFGDNFPRQWYISLISILYIYFFGKQFKGPINVMFTPRSLNFSRNERRLNRYKINNDKATASRGHTERAFPASRAVSPRRERLLAGKSVRICQPWICHTLPFFSNCIFHVKFGQIFILRLIQQKLSKEIFTPKLLAQWTRPEHV